MVKVLEAKLVEKEAKVAEFLVARCEFDRLASEMGGAGLAFLPAALRSLAESEAQLRLARIEVEDVRRQLLGARSRQKTLSTKVGLLREAQERKIVEEDAREAALAMMGSSSGQA